jgi:hypothetical protein
MNWDTVILGILEHHSYGQAINPTTAVINYRGFRPPGMASVPIRQRHNTMQRVKTNLLRRNRRRTLLWYWVVYRKTPGTLIPWET